jgi:hypothetical protein
VSNNIFPLSIIFKRDAIHLWRALVKKGFAEKRHVFAQILEVLLLCDVHLYHMIFRINDFALAWISSILWGQLTIGLLYLFNSLYLSTVHFAAL